LIGDDEGRVERLVFPASTLDSPDRLRGECPELFRISAEDTRRMIPHLAGRDVFEAVNQLPDVRWYPVTEPWIEIDTPEDLERAGGVWERISGA
jgi:NDP-sugar pyrophosphorylase family protein